MSYNQPECDCYAKPGQKHDTDCNALRPSSEQVIVPEETAEQYRARMNQK